MSLLLRVVDLFSGAIVSLPLVMLVAFYFDQNHSKRKWIWISVYVLYLNAMFMKVGIPGITYITWQPIVNLMPFHDFSLRNVLGMILNVIMLIPLGFLFPLYFKRYEKWYFTVGAGFLMSITIEVIQLFSFRATDIDDVLMNTLGTAIGYVLSIKCVKSKRVVQKENLDWVKVAIMNSIVLLVIIFIRYPMMEFFYTYIVKA